MSRSRNDSVNSGSSSKRDELWDDWQDKIRELDKETKRIPERQVLKRKITALKKDIREYNDREEELEDKIDDHYLDSDLEARIKNAKAAHDKKPDSKTRKKALAKLEAMKKEKEQTVSDLASVRKEIEENVPGLETEMKENKTRLKQFGDIEELESSVRKARKEWEKAGGKSDEKLGVIKGMPQLPETKKKPSKRETVLGDSRARIARKAEEERAGLRKAATDKAAKRKFQNMDPAEKRELLLDAVRLAKPQSSPRR